jgi:hypothetical protein
MDVSVGYVDVLTPGADYITVSGLSYSSVPEGAYRYSFA